MAKLNWIRIGSCQICLRLWRWCIGHSKTEIL